MVSSRVVVIVETLIKSSGKRYKSLTVELRSWGHSAFFKIGVFEMNESCES